jgi:protein-S-isoprenylcysteine O-methyltransferase Ste14
MNDAKKKHEKHVEPAHPPAASPAAAPKAGVIPWPPVIYVLGIAASLVLDALYPLPWFGSPMSDILVAVGWLALLAMAALFFTAFRAMARAKTPVNPNAQPEHLVTEGPFGITRNPIYLADTLLLIGVGLVSGITWFLPLAVIAAFITQRWRSTRRSGGWPTSSASATATMPSASGAGSRLFRYPGLAGRSGVDAKLRQPLDAGLLGVVELGQRLFQIAALLPEILALLLDALDH